MATKLRALQAEVSDDPDAGKPAYQLSDEQLQKRIARNLTWARELRFGSQAEAAKHFGLNEPTWHRYEKGERKIPMHLLLRACREFRVTLDYIYTSSLRGMDEDKLMNLCAAHPVLLDESQVAVLGTSSAPAARPAAKGTSRPNATGTTRKARVPAT